MILKGCIVIDENLLSSLDAKDKESLQLSLKSLIDQTYVIEKEYKSLNESYISLQNFIKDIVETLPNAIWVVDIDNKLFLQNSEAKRLVNLFAYINLEETHKEIEFGNSFYLIKIVKNQDKTIISATDITDEKRKERLASMGQVAAHLAHEIRNPIGSISLLASSLFKRAEIKNKPIVLEMQKAIWRVERIIKATLLFTKGIQLNTQNFNILELKNECEQSIEYYTYSKDIKFEFDFCDIFINGDKDLLSLVLQNMIFNAIDAIEESDDESGKIIINSYAKNNEIFIDIQDSGIAVKNKNMLFEPFKSTKIKGNGLGLALSIQIIKAHNGDIILEENPKKFSIKLNKFENI